jgi:hypothetical protein
MDEGEKIKDKGMTMSKMSESISSELKRKLKGKG